MGTHSLLRTINIHTDKDALLCDTVNVLEIHLNNSERACAFNFTSNCGVIHTQHLVELNRQGLLYHSTGEEPE